MILPDLFDSNMGSPKVFQQYSVDSLYLKNSEQYILLFLGLGFLYFLVKLMQKLVINQDDESKIKQLINLMVENF
jgi:hypothetical protein